MSQNHKNGQTTQMSKRPDCYEIVITSGGRAVWWAVQMLVSANLGPSFFTSCV